MQGSSPKTSSLYDTDFYAWANQQAALLRAGRFGEADIPNIVDGRAEKRALVSRITILLLHLLKWQFQPERRGRSWELTLAGLRLDLREHLSDDPSLKSQLAAAMASAFRRARIEAAQETGLDLDMFPEACPWSYDEVVDDAFWPGA